MKNKKILGTVLAATCLLGVASCSGEVSSAKSLGYYSANKTISYQNFQPQYNYFFFTINSQGVELFDDNTYCFDAIQIVYSNVTFGPDVPSDKFTANEKGHSIVKYYGSYTVKEEDADFKDVTLSAPTRVTTVSQGSMMIDTANWTEEMSTTVTPEGGEAVTSEAYLATQAEKFGEGVDLTIVLSTYSFAHVNALDATVSIG